MFSRPDEPAYRQQLRDSVSDFIARDATLSGTRDVLASDGAFLASRWKKMADLGWTSMLAPEHVGGLDMTHADLAALFHEMGRGALPEPVITVSLLAGQAIALGENPDLQKNVLPDLLAGDRMASFAWQAAPGGMGADCVGPDATRTQDGWLLSGRAIFVPHAAQATGYVVAAKAETGTLLAWIDAAPTVTAAVPLVDGTVQSTISVDGVAVAARNIIAAPETGQALLEQVLDIARLGIVAQLQGLMEQAFEMTLAFLKEREQFNKPIAAFQALQHRMVNLYVQIEMAQSALLRAVRALDDPKTDRSERASQVSAAKSRAGDAAQAVIKECIQLHGAIGYTAEYDLSLFVNRILVLTATLGNPRVHRARWLTLHKTRLGGSHVH